MSTKTILVFSLAFVLGFAIWLFSTYFTGDTEPWDASILYYFGGLFVAGLISGFLEPKRMLLWSLAIYLGQFTFILAGLFTKPGAEHELLGAGLVVMLFFSLISLLGSFIGLILKSSFRRS